MLYLIPSVSIGRPVAMCVLSSLHMMHLSAWLYQVRCRRMAIRCVQHMCRVCAACVHNMCRYAAQGVRHVCTTMGAICYLVFFTRKKAVNHPGVGGSCLSVGGLPMSLFLFEILYPCVWFTFQQVVGVVHVSVGLAFE